MTNTTNNATERIKRITYDKLAVDLRRFSITKAGLKKSINPERYEILQAVNGTPEYVQATDSRRAIRVKREYVGGLPEGDFTINAKTGDDMAGNYPEMTRLYPESYEEEYFIPYDKLKAARDALKDVYEDVKKREVDNLAVTVELKDGHLTFKAWGRGANDYGEVRTVKNAYDFRCKDATFRINAKYLSEALLTVNKLRSYGDKYKLLNGFLIRYVSNMRPITITDGDMYEILILPLRTF